MKISDLAIDKRTTVFVLLLLIILMGGYRMATLPKESEPEIVIPIASVVVTYTGVSPEDMENLVTSPIERKLTGISGVKKITSTSTEGISSIIVEFEPDVDVDDATQKVKDKVDLAKADLPEDADDPIVSDTNMAESPVVFASLTGPVSVSTLTKIAEDLEDKIESLPGILDVMIIGEVEREIHIVVDPARILHYGVSLADLVRLTSVENVNTPAGSMDVGEGKYLVRVPGEIHSPDDLRDLVVKRGENGIVYLRDLAEIRDGFKDSSTYSRLDGVSSVTIVARKRAGVNIIDVANNVKDLLREAEATLPQGVRLVVTQDESTRIDQMYKQLVNSIGSGLVLVLGVIFLFLGFRNAIFVALAIPVSLFITFIVMDIVGMTLNMVTMFSLMVALGMLVDNGIVVIENIYRHAQMGYSRVAAAKKGTAEVAWPVIGSSLTTVVAFLPMVFWPGVMGRFLSLIPKTVIITLFASLFVGLIVNPALAAVFVKVPESKKNAHEERHPVLDVYERVLRWALRWRMVTVAIALTFQITIIGLFFVNPRFEFLAYTEPDQAFLNIELPEGSNLDATDAIVRQIEEIVRVERDKLDYITASIGSTGPNVREGMPGASVRGDSSNIGRVSMVFPDFSDRPEAPSEIIRRVRELFDGIIGADIRLAEANMGPPTGAPINIEVQGDDFHELTRIAREVKEIIADVPGLVDLRDNMERGKPEVRVIIDRQQAAMANLNTQYIGMTVQAAVQGRKAGEYREGDDEYDVIVKFPEEFSKAISNIETMSLVNLDGRGVPFSSVARLEQGAGLGSITRINRRRTVTVIAETVPDAGTEVLNKVQARLANYELPAGYSLAFTGQNEEMKETEVFLKGAFFVSLFLIFLVLITQFNSLAQPFVIMSSVILSLGGVFMGLLVFDMPFGLLMTGIGCVSLSGIVVNNAIVLVDYTNKLRDQGLTLVEAIVRAGRTRFRPVLLTAVTTILGLLPLGLGISFDFYEWRMSDGGTQSAYWGSMAVAIIFGLTFATFLTLIIVPVLYSAVTRETEQSGPPDSEGIDSAAIPAK